MFFGRNDAKAETPVLWPPHAKSWLLGKDSDAGRDWGQEEKGTTENEMAGWHHWLDGRESEWTPGVGDGHGGLVCCDSWGRKESDTTEWLIWSDLIFPFFYLAFCMFYPLYVSSPLSLHLLFHPVTFLYYFVKLFTLLQCLSSYPEITACVLNNTCQVASVASNSVRPHGLQPTRLLHPWDSPGKNTGVGCHFLLHNKS